MTTKQHYRWGLKIKRLSDAEQREADEFMKFLYNNGLTTDEIANLKSRSINEFERPMVVSVRRKKLFIAYKKTIVLSGTPWELWCRKSMLSTPFVFYKNLPITCSKIPQQRRGYLFSPIEVEAKVKGMTPVDIEPIPAPITNLAVEQIRDKMSARRREAHCY